MAKGRTGGRRKPIKRRAVAKPLTRDDIAASLQAAAPVAPPDAIAAALDGDAESCSALVTYAQDNRRGLVLKHLYAAGVWGDGLRDAIRRAWDLSHLHVLDSITRPQLLKMMQVADFGAPPFLTAPVEGAPTSTVSVWRGVASLYPSPASHCGGLSWTTDRDVAYWFAMRDHDAPDTWYGTGRRLQALVLRAEIPVSDIVYWSDDRGEGEVVVARRLESAVVDGDPDAWRAGYERRVAAVREQERAEFEEARRRRLAAAGPST